MRRNIMKKCKFYSEEIDKCLFDGPPDVCPFENNESNCACFIPIEYEKKSYPSAFKYDKVETVKLMLDNGSPIDETTLTIQNCDKIILKPRSLEVEVKIEIDNFDDFDYIIINGIKFKKV